MAKSKKNNQEVELLKGQLARALADYDNLRKRVESEKIAWEQIAATRAISGLLPVFDMLLDAQEHLKDAGLEIVIGEFRKSIQDLGVEEIRVAVGDEFNPLEEEAIEMVAGGKENTVAEVVQIGWKIKDQEFIIRPAKVKVFKVSN
ncbi:MAG: nucleotide exchange factor GrpE [Candidatus Microgenomates bacterium]|jgi:molecular chaperone GrpE